MVSKRVAAPVLAGLALVVALFATAATAAAPTFTPWSAAVNLGPVVNSPTGSESGPALSADGLSLYYYTVRPGGYGSTDIFVSQRPTVHDPWGAPVNLGPTVNSASQDFVPAFSSDGHWMFFASDRPGGYGGVDLYQSYRLDIHDDFGWQTPTNLGSNVNTAAAENGNGYFDNAGSPQLFFGSDRLGPVGNSDLYVTNRQTDGTWGLPTRIAELSSAVADNRPSVRQDGLEIFFYSSRTTGSVGAQDVWTATRATVDAPWSTPVSLGPTVNSTFNDIHPYLSADGQTLIFSSARASGGVFLDLYMTTRDATPTVSGFSVGAVEGVSFSGAVATVTDPDTAATAGEYAATIDWGDGSPVAVGTVSGSGGSFSVSGSHTYAEEGSYTVTTTLGDIDTPAITVTATSTATVADATLTAGALTLGAATEGSGATSASFAFSDANAGATAADFAATITWGDGSSSPGTVTADGTGFKVAGSHAYADEGSYPVTVTVLDEGGSTVAATDTATVADAALTAGLINVSCGSGPCVVTFGFGDANPGATVADFTATINWGDGSSSAGVVSASGGGFVVSGSHVYADDGGGHAITVTVTDDGGSTVSSTAPTATAMLLAKKSGGDDNENNSSFTVVVTCSSGTATALLNGVAVKNGDVVRLKLIKKGDQKVKKEDGRLTISATSFQLVVTCTDAAGNTGSAATSPVFKTHGHDESKDEFRQHHDDEIDH
jgi:hypothetical protein